MTRIELLHLLEKEAKLYSPKSIDSIRRNYHSHNLSDDKPLDIETIQAVLVDFINFLAVGQNIDYGLRVKHLSTQDEDV